MTTEHKMIDGQRFTIVKDKDGRVLAQAACSDAPQTPVSLVTLISQAYWAAGESRQLSQQHRDDLLVLLATRLLR